MTDVIGVTITPSEFLSRAESFAGDWHESRLPHAMRERGVTGVKFLQISDTGFELQTTGLDNRFGSAVVGACRAEIEPTESGARIKYSFSLGRRSKQVLAAIAALVVMSALLTGDWVGVILGGFFFLGALIPFSLWQLGLKRKATAEFREMLFAIGGFASQTTPSNAR